MRLLVIISLLAVYGCAYRPAVYLDVLNESVERSNAVEQLAYQALENAKALDALAREVGSDGAKAAAVGAVYGSKNNLEVFGEERQHLLDRRDNSLSSAGAFFDSVGGLLSGDFSTILLSIFGLGGAGAAFGAQRKTRKERERGDRLEAKGSRLADMDPDSAMAEVRKDPDFRFIN